MIHKDMANLLDVVEQIKTQLKDSYYDVDHLERDLQITEKIAMKDIRVHYVKIAHCRINPQSTEWMKLKW